MTFQRKIRYISSEDQSNNKEDLNIANSFRKQYDEQQNKCMELSRALKVRYRTAESDGETVKIEAYYGSVSSFSRNTRVKCILLTPVLWICGSPRLSNSSPFASCTCPHSNWKSLCDYDQSVQLSTPIL